MKKLVETCKNNQTFGLTRLTAKVEIEEKTRQSTENNQTFDLFEFDFKN